ncbi:MAG: class I SAM-dependent methyltransferase [Clostridia bacterium]|nr:class I SAM-dependent methyltransferase [Clostridia bacterium]
MDLHDYADVAENYDLYLAEMYRNGGGFDGFEDFYLALARKYGQGGVIDIACGTGAVLLHLARAGIMADGVDLSEAMVEVAREKALREGLALNIFPGNMASFDSGRRYSLAIIARSGFMHLLTPALQRQALLNIRGQLVDGGVLTLNTFAPNPALQAVQMKTGPEDYAPRVEYVNSQGMKERIDCAIGYDPLTQVMSGNWRFVTLDGAGRVVSERVRPLAMRQTYKQEMMYLFELCGFEIIEVYGDYHGSVEETGHYVWVVRKG